jgi:hypothetical protein
VFIAVGLKEFPLASVATVSLYCDAGPGLITKAQIKKAQISGG